MSDLDELAAYALGLSWDSLPADTIENAKLFLLDTLACGLAGSGADVAEPVLRAVRGWGGGPCRVAGLDAGFSLHGGAVMGAYAIHCLEWDAVHEPAVVHAMSVATAALLAEIQSPAHGRVSGWDFLAALIVAVDIAAGLGVATEAPLRFFRPATAGLMGAVAGIARLRKFPAARMKDALGLGYSQVAGTMQAHVEGSPALAVQVALSARAALTACDLAESGLSGPHDVLSGPFGYFTLIEDGGDARILLDRLGTVFAIDELSIKPYPSGRASHGVLSTVLARRADGTVAGDTLERLEARVPPLVHRLVGRPWAADMGPAYARLCLPFLVALALRDGRIDPRAFTPDDFADAALRVVGDRVHVSIDDNPDLNALSPQTLVFHLSDGRTLTDHIPATLGAPDNPLSRDARLDKLAFAGSLARVPLTEPARERLTAGVETLETLPDCRDLFDLLAPAR